MPHRFAALLLLFASLAGLARAATFEELNAALGLPLFLDENLWGGSADEAAQRLGWPEESRTTTDSSFRKYPGSGDVVLGSRPYSLALYGEQGNVSAISMMFANKGDAVDLVTGRVDSKKAGERGKQIKTYQEAIKADKDRITSALTAALGEPVADRFGQGSQTRESVLRWDWKGHAILLAAPRDEYVAVRILPLAVADLKGKSRVPDAVLRGRLSTRVENRANGDVVLKDIPMVDQGPKGYCVPATWERVMRYMGIPADMYILAMAGDTKAGGGTSIGAIAAGAKEAITRGGRQFAAEAGKVSILNIKKCISRGLPVMWAVCVDRELDQAQSLRTRERGEMADPAAWKAQLGDARKAAKKIHNNPRNGHVRMIIGYNETTGEIAFSDSWGASAAERWMTEEEAQAISQGGYQYINF